MKDAMMAGAEPMRRIPKPRPGEYPPYARMYLDLLPDDDRLLEHLTGNLQVAIDLVSALPEERLLHRYAPGKWTIRETLVHVVDDERIYACRALCFARGETTPLPGFEQDDYAAASGANARSLRSILAEYAAVRHATIALFEGLDEAALTRTGVANGNRASVRALGWHIAGHELHHLKLLRERYAA
ncbi:MAG TPA: DinB family protein [Longimicrobium sp.]|nr:DinB family protein [Longimicrobium sp.]